MPKSRKRGALGDLRRRRDALLAILLATDPLLIGTLYTTLRRCGNPSCRCVDRPSHRQTLFLGVVQGRRRCRFVRQGTQRRLQDAWDRYRLWKRSFKEFRSLQAREIRLIKQLAQRRAVRFKS